MLMHGRAGVWASLFFVFMTTVWAYWPTLQHAPRYDQMAYLANAARKPDLVSLTLGSYNLNRKSRVDPHLFRPLLYVFLGLEFWLFKYYFSLWHMTGIVLHLGVVWALFGLVSVLAPQRIALAGAAFFSLMLTNVPMVNWENIHAYLVFVLLMMIALKEVACYVRSNADESGRMLPVVLCLTCGAFIFEAGVMFALLLSAGLGGLSLRQKTFRRAAVWCVLPAVLYFLASLLDLFASGQALSAEASGIVSGAMSFQTVVSFAQAVKWFIFAGVFAGPGDMVETTRTVLLSRTLDWSWPLSFLTVDLLGGVFVAAVSLAAFVLGWPRHLHAWRKRFLMLLGAWILGYVVLIVLGRVNTRGVLLGLSFNAYYFYIFWALFLVFFLGCIDWEKLAGLRTWRWVRWIGFLSVAGAVLVNAVAIHHVNMKIAYAHRDVRELVTKLDGFVLLHQGEADFSFYMAPGACPGDEIGAWFQNRKSPQGARYTLAQVLYPRYFNAENPKYRISCLSP